MNAKGIVFAAVFVASGSAQAQLADPPPPRLEAEADGRFGPLAAGFRRYSPLYGGNETANPNDRLFPGFRTDPRLVIGYAFNQYLSVETGYSHLRDQGFHKPNLFDPREAAIDSAVGAGVLGAKSHSTYLAAKISVPVNERLTAYGKLGVAQSVVKNDGFVTPQMAEAQAGGKSTTVFGSETATGAYGALGAKYKLNDKATLKGEVIKNGSADKFRSNSTGVRGSVGFGF
jgi:opacity protein-like surface antigen